MVERDDVIRALGCLTGNRHRAVTQQECRASGCPYSGQDCEIAVMEDALKLLKGQEPRWISVKDRMPPANDLVIVSINDDRGDNDYRYTSLKASAGLWTMKPL